MKGLKVDSDYSGSMEGRSECFKVTVRKLSDVRQGKCTNYKNSKFSYTNWISKSNKAKSAAMFKFEIPLTFKGKKI
jgi:hypothetical protein